MSLFVNIRPVPFRLLDDLLAQMEGNNERLIARQGDKSGSTTRPRPQRPVFNADASTYRRPEPAASPRGRGIAVIGHEFVEDTFSGPEAISSRWRLTTIDGGILEYEMPYATVGPVPYWEDSFEATVETSGDGLGADETVWYPEGGVGPLVEITKATSRYVRITLGATSGVHLIPTGGSSGVLLHIQSTAKSYTRDSEYYYQYIGYERTGETLTTSQGEFYQARFVQYSYKEQLEEITIGPVYVVAAKAFAFNHRGVREVAMGEAAKSALGYWYPNFTIDPQRIEVYEAPSGTYSGYTGTRGNHQTAFVNNGQMPRNLFQNYGFRRISALGDVGPTTFSPAVYAMFQNYESVSSPTETSSFSPVLGATQDYSNATIKLVELGSSLPSLFVEPRREVPAPGPIVYYSTKSPPASTSEFVPEEMMRKYPVSKPGKAVVPAGGAGVLYQLWDWGNPGYCRQQAVSLGFALGDLTP
jgi:hypothetical protein